MKHGMLVLVSSTLVVVGCGRSPAARTPVQMVRVPAEQVALVEGCACEDDDDDAEEATPPKRSVQYVDIDAWEPPASVQKLERKIQRRGASPPDYVTMPSLTLHRPIAPTTFYGRRGYYYR